jgi:hypothetical protein
VTKYLELSTLVECLIFYPQQLSIPNSFLILCLVQGGVGAKQGGGAVKTEDCGVQEARSVESTGYQHQHHHRYHYHYHYCHYHYQSMNIAATSTTMKSFPLPSKVGFFV